jgi:hypothetical protein
MMADTPLATIVERINRALENVVAPEVKSTIVRGQLFAVVELLNQLPGRFEYRHDFLGQDIARCRAMLADLVGGLAAAGLTVPEEASSSVRPVDLAGMSGDQLREERDRVESAVSVALDLVHAHKDVVGAAAGGLEKAVLDRLLEGNARDLGLFRPQRFDRISQRAPKEP